MKFFYIVCVLVCVVNPLYSAHHGFKQSSIQQREQKQAVLQERIMGSGIPGEKSWTVGKQPISGVNINGYMKGTVTFEVKEKAAVQNTEVYVKADNNIVKMMQVFMSNNILHIILQSPNNDKITWKIYPECTVSFPVGVFNKLEGVTSNIYTVIRPPLVTASLFVLARGSSTVVIKSIAVEKLLSLGVEHSGRIVVGSVEAPKADIFNHGRDSIVINSGRVESLTCSIDDRAQFLATRLLCNNVAFRVAGLARFSAKQVSGVVKEGGCVEHYHGPSGALWRYSAWAATRVTQGWDIESEDDIDDVESEDQRDIQLIQTAVLWTLGKAIEFDNMPLISYAQ